LTGVNSVFNDSKNNWAWIVLRIPAGLHNNQAVTASLEKTIAQDNDSIIFRFGRV